MYVLAAAEYTFGFVPDFINEIAILTNSLITETEN